MPKAKRVKERDDDDEEEEEEEEEKEEESSEESESGSEDVEEEEQDPEWDESCVTPAVIGGRGLHSSTFQLNLSRF